ncbi:MAG: hypothetical protein J6W23_00670 [Victivallales bacterium]|nr:hypothetical protein [Victivallales bacterium]
MRSDIFTLPPPSAPVKPPRLQKWRLPRFSSRPVRLRGGRFKDAPRPVCAPCLWSAGGHVAAWLAKLPQTAKLL